MLQQIIFVLGKRERGKYLNVKNMSSSNSDEPFSQLWWCMYIASIDNTNYCFITGNNFAFLNYVCYRIHKNKLNISRYFMTRDDYYSIHLCKV